MRNPHSSPRNHFFLDLSILLTRIMPQADPDPSGRHGARVLWRTVQFYHPDGKPQVFAFQGTRADHVAPLPLTRAAIATSGTRMMRTGKIAASWGVNLAEPYVESIPLTLRRGWGRSPVRWIAFKTPNGRTRLGVL